MRLIAHFGLRVAVVLGGLALATQARSAEPDQPFAMMVVEKVCRPALDLKTQITEASNGRWSDRETKLRSEAGLGRMAVIMAELGFTNDEREAAEMLCVAYVSGSSDAIDAVLSTIQKASK